MYTFIIIIILVYIAIVFKHAIPLYILHTNWVAAGCNGQSWIWRCGNLSVEARWIEFRILNLILTEQYSLAAGLPQWHDVHVNNPVLALESKCSIVYHVKYFLINYMLIRYNWWGTFELPFSGWSLPGFSRREYCNARKNHNIIIISELVLGL